MTPRCAFDPCEEPRHGRTYCTRHLRRFKAGEALTALVPTGRSAVTAEGRLLARVDRTGSCWLWRGAPNSSGYGKFTPPGERSVYVHRWAFAYYVGPIPKGYEVDHLCKVRMCCNPEHLEAVLPAVNKYRSDSWAGIHKRTTHCPRDHEYTEANTKRNRKGHRRCRTCDNLRKRVGWSGW